MRYHDFHLSGYSVSDFGSKILLHLVFDYPGRPKEQSQIEFSEVACYHFVHTSPAIITDIEEESLQTFVKKEGDLLSTLDRKHGLSYWKTDDRDYLHNLQMEGFRAWRLSSAVGFGGFVVARTVHQRQDSNKALQRTRASRSARRTKQTSSAARSRR